MQINDRILRSEEQIVFNLRELYRTHGYTCFKMSKFEEYDLYGQNKDFLVSDSVITFNDTNGKLMALKPDVTLSIVKNYKKSETPVQRVFYNENIYRISDKTHCYKEIMQSGIECLGDLSDYNFYEVTNLAAESLASVSPCCVLNISHLGIIAAVLREVQSDTLKKELIKCVSDKNSHGIKEICEQNGVGDYVCEMLTLLASTYGEPHVALDKLRRKTDDPAVLEAVSVLERITENIKNTDCKVNIDFSLINDMSYYNGLVFQGFIKDIPYCVLSGGQYDKLLKKLGKAGGAIGFAVYLDQLERMKKADDYDFDVLLLYSENDDADKVYGRMRELISMGKSVCVQKDTGGKVLCREIEHFEVKE